MNAFNTELIISAELSLNFLLFVKTSDNADENIFESKRNKCKVNKETTYKWAKMLDNAVKNLLQVETY